MESQLKRWSIKLMDALESLTMASQRSAVKPEALLYEEIPTFRKTNEQFETVPEKKSN